MLLVASEGWKWSLQLRFSDAALDLSWHFAIFRCAIPLVFLKESFSSQRIFPTSHWICWQCETQFCSSCSCIITPRGTWPKQKANARRRLCFLCLQIAVVSFVFCWSDWKLVCNGSIPSVVCELVCPVLHFGETNVQHQSKSAHMAPILCSCEVKVTGASCVYRHVYPVASLTVKAHTHKWFSGCIKPAGWRMLSPI